ATVLAAVDLPRPWSITAQVQAALIPVVTALNNTSRGYVHVVSIEAEDMDPWLISRYFMNVPGTNPLGIFIIVYTSTRGLTMGAQQEVFKAFFQVLGTTRVIQLIPDAHIPYVTLLDLDTFHMVKNKWRNGYLYLPEFCEGQFDEHTRNVPLLSRSQQLKGFRFEFVLREQNVWMDKRGNTRAGGRDFMFAKMLTEFGMQWKIPENSSLIQKFREGNVELGLPVHTVATYWKYSFLRSTE
ncbi:Protein of unknown function, partial [Gryllus bimaculatus]